MGIALTANEAKALRDAIRTDYSVREQIIMSYQESTDYEAEDVAKIVTEAKERLATLDNADMVLMSVYQYPDEPEGFKYK